MKRVAHLNRARCECPVRARFLKNLCLPLAILLLLALSLTLLLRWSQRNQEPPEPVEKEAEEWTTEDDGRQEWAQDQAARQDRAIVYLANRSCLKELALSVELLFRVFNDRFRYRILVFHGHDVNRQKALHILNTRLKARQLTLIEMVRLEDFYTFPRGFDRKLVEQDRSRIVAGELFPKYQRVSAFWFHGVFLQSRLHNVKYIMRLDTDSRLYGPIEYDLFDYMERNGVKYAYRARHQEDTCCARHLYRAVRDFMFDYRLETSLSRDLEFLVHETEASIGADMNTSNPVGRQPQAYAGGLELLHLPSFRGDGLEGGGPIVWAWAQETWEDARYAGLYRLRWSDGLLRFQAVHLFPQLHRHTHMLCDLHHQHGIQAFPATCNYTETPKAQWPVPRSPIQIDAYNNFCQKTGQLDCGKYVSNFDM